ncbi:MAG: TraR/DksA family transcriptional regulator [Thermoguttaceae bacterium]
MPSRYKNVIKNVIQTKPTNRDRARAKSLELLKEELLVRRESLRREIQGEKADFSTLCDRDMIGDIAELALNYTEDELDYQLAEVGSREWMQIERAIERINEGTYGVCEMCQCPIPIARLKALPFAERCVRCQQLAEDEASRENFNGWKTYDFVNSGTSSGTHVLEYD